MKDEVYQAAWKRFYVAKPRSTEGSGWLRGTNLVLMTSTGRLLSGTLKDRNSLAAALKEVLQAYARLPEEERRAIQFFFLNSRDGTETARLLGRSRSGTYALINRAVATLARWMGADRTAGEISR